MISSNTTLIILATVIFLLMLALFDPFSRIGKIRIAGRAKQKYTRQEMLDIPLAEDHMIMLVETMGLNENLGKTDYGEGAEFIFREFIDMVNGNGTHNGYVIQKHRDGAEVIARFNGEIHTKIVNGIQEKTVNGTWTKIRGTKQFEGIEGNGIYSGLYISENEYIVNWSGNYIVN